MQQGRYRLVKAAGRQSPGCVEPLCHLQAGHSLQLRHGICSCVSWGLRKCGCQPVLCWLFSRKLLWRSDWVTRIQMALLNTQLGLSLSHLSSTVIQRHFSITGACQAIQKLTRVRVVDNSALGNTPYHRPPKCIHVYNKTGVGKVGDTILLAIKGEKKKALIVGHKMPGPTMTPRFDSNNVVLIEDNGNPVGTRIKTPIPYMLRRKGEFSKVLAIARNFV
ncbi:39S ribosomal protein L14, mitochondrial isoform X3 [Rissa tridactyla]|uniref:39S ribosomal protein L14, mitochondrial isoform X3 n=1 Tax=Rissa tridactyla TaxID=75485 RepID=UPI0023BA5EA1|nr:39S ribosomal protein L14, mitochondrial isoform X3 [Rissa tridactyla]